jgi:hypothetical protein
MRDDEEVIAAYERELSEVGGDAVEPGEPTRRGSGRGFWIVAGALGLGCVLLVVQIFANRQIAETIAHAQSTLRTVESEAEEVLAETGGFADADAAGLELRAPAFTYREAGDRSRGLDQVSVSATTTVWAAAVRAGDRACFYLRLEVGQDATYGVGPQCTGAAALGASDPRW